MIHEILRADNSCRRKERKIKWKINAQIHSNVDFKKCPKQEKSASNNVFEDYTDKKIHEHEFNI